MVILKNNFLAERLAFFRPLFGQGQVLDTYPKNAVAISIQKTRQERLQCARVYATEKMRAPAMKQYYSDVAKRRRYSHAYVAAVFDYMKEPEIKKIETSGYSGLPGQRIFIEAADHLKIDTVFVRVLRADETVLESGYATRAYDLCRWKYITTVKNSALAGTKINAIATDRPGHEALLEIIL